MKKAGSRLFPGVSKHPHACPCGGPLILPLVGIFLLQTQGNEVQQQSSSKPLAGAPRDDDEMRPRTFASDR